MVNQEKVYQMTRAALFEKKEEKREIRIVNYKRRDYLFTHILLSLLFATISYALLIGFFMFIIVNGDASFVLSVAETVLLILMILAGYIALIIFYYLLSRRFYINRYRKAIHDVKRYLIILQKIRACEDGMQNPKRKEAK